MQRISKGLFWVIVLSLILIFPRGAYALSKETSYININNSGNLQIGDLSFSNITYKDDSSSSTMAFGLTGTVTNDLDTSIRYISEVYYYDASYNLILSGSKSGLAIPGDNDYNHMLSQDSNINDIRYYRLVITLNDNSIENPTLPSKDNQYKSYEYVIDKYDVDIVVNENNTLDITETITAFFNVPKHGIYRTIPLSNKIVRLDGTSSKNRAEITNVIVDNDFTSSRENGNYKLKIGSADHSITGEQTYIIKYTYNLGKDPIKNYDELYFNIIGSEWDTIIGNVSFKITMPKEFDSSKLGFSSGEVGSTNNSGIVYNVSGNIITGSYNGTLKVGEALTVRCELPEGYFVGAGLTTTALDYFIFIFPIIFLLISILLWYVYGRDSMVVETVEFYPPEGFNSLELGYLYKGLAEHQDVTSLLIYLANKGYIKIVETDKESLLSNYKIVKLKEYDGKNENEAIFLKGLFTKKPAITSIFMDNEPSEKDMVNEVTEDDLEDNFYKTTDRILANINTKENTNKIFEKKASSKKIFISLMIIATYFIITFPPVYYYGNDELLFYILPLTIVSTTFTFLMIIGEPQDYQAKLSVDTSILGILFGLGLGIVIWISMLFPLLSQEPIYLIGYILGIACIFGMQLCLKYLPKRTPYGNELIGKILGFKNFLELAEKDELEAMVEENPTYFYDILPYTYVLDVSDKWINKFESITTKAPSWYEGSGSFDMITFSSFMTSTMSSAESAMTSSPSSGSDSSGGGSSDGGSGGGGGGSW